MKIRGWCRETLSNYFCTVRRMLCTLVLLAGLFFFVSNAPALDIQQLWVANPDMVMEGAPMVVDLDGDGDAEILTAAYEHIIVVDGLGTELWRFDTRGRYSTCPAILERPAERPLIYAGDNTGLFTCLDGTGKVVWQAETSPIFCASPALADLDGDGSIEVVQGDKSGVVHAFDALTGQSKWTRTIDGECACPAIGDLDGDGLPEIVIATGAGKVFALNSSGNVIWEFAVGGTSQDWATCSPIIFGNSKEQDLRGGGFAIGTLRLPGPAGASCCGNTRRAAPSRPHFQRAISTRMASPIFSSSPNWACCTASTRMGACSGTSTRRAAVWHRAPSSIWMATGRWNTCFARSAAICWSSASPARFCSIINLIIAPSM